MKLNGKAPKRFWKWRSKEKKNWDKFQFYPEDQLYEFKISTKTLKQPKQGKYIYFQLPDLEVSWPELYTNMIS